MQRGCLWLHGDTVLPMFSLLLEDSPSFWLTFLNVYLCICQLFELVFQLFWPSAGRKLWDYVSFCVKLYRFGVGELEAQQVWLLHSHSCKASSLPRVCQSRGSVLARQRLPALILTGKMDMKTDSMRWCRCRDKRVSGEHVLCSGGELSLYLGRVCTKRGGSRKRLV